MPKKLIQYLHQQLIKLLCCFISFASIDGTAFATVNIEGIQIYKKNNLHLSLERKQKLADDITRYQNADNLWDVIRDEFSLPHYEDNPYVQEQIDRLMNNQDFLLRSASRAAPYLYYILQQIRKRHLPVEFVLLPIIESGYSPFDYSTAGAAGIWQMMPGTASGYGIRQDFWYDGRRDVVASTRAALNHLAYLENFFDGNWLLAIAAYDTGEGNVLSAIRRNIREGKDTDFWSLPLAQETREYVPRFLALATIISHPEKYPIYFPQIKNAPYLAQIDVGPKMDLNYAASLAGISFKKLMQLNSGYNRSSTSPTGPNRLVLPIENVEQFIENLAQSPLNHGVDWVHYKVKSGDKLVAVAKKFNTSIEALRKMNQLSSNNIRAGTNLLIPLSKQKPKSEDSFPNNRVAQNNNSINNTFNINQYVLKPGDTIYMVRRHDSLARIARHFHVSEKSLQLANKLNSNRITPGRQLVIPTHTASLTARLSSEKVFPGDTIYMVRHGDSIETIAQKFRTTAAAIRVANLLQTNELREGDRLVIPTHIRG